MSARGNPLIKRCRDNRVATHQMRVIILCWRRIAERRIRKAGSAGKRPVTTTQAVIFGMMLYWTPSLVLLALLLGRAPPDPD